MRTRTKRSGAVRGVQYERQDGNWVEMGELVKYSQIDTCSDELGRGSDHPCDIQHWKFSGGLSDGYGLIWHFTGWPVGYETTNVGRYTGGIILPQWQDYYNRILAQSGPLTPRVYAPLFLYELKDIPLMLRHAGNLLHKIRSPSGLSPHKEAAASTLAYQFGWAPLMQDIGRMLQFSESVAKRQVQLMKANSRRGLLRRIKLGSDTQTHKGGPQTLTSTWGWVINASWSETCNYDQWATIRWRAKDESQFGRVPSYMDAFRATYGLNRGHIPIEIWKAVPWSWAIDWFADISNVLQANYNSIYYDATGLNIMQHYQSERTYRAVPSKGFPGLTVNYERKRRTIHPSPTASLHMRIPFLDTFKLSILGSMTILRVTGR